MTAAVFAQIAAYFQKAHDDVVWPVAGQTTPPATGGRKQRRRQKHDDPPPPPPGGDKHAEFNEALLVTYARAVRLFNPFKPCTDSGECKNQGEICIDGECRKPGGEGALALAQRCTFNDDCRNQGEICIDGFCVPSPYGLVVQTGQVQIDFEGLRRSLFAYYTRIQDLLVAGLAKDPGKLVSVRNLLMQMYADLSAAAGKPGCTSNGDCPEGYVCVDGRCVPYPFKLVFSSALAPMPAPWM